MRYKTTQIRLLLERVFIQILNLRYSAQITVFRIPLSWKHVSVAIIFVIVTTYVIVNVRRKLYGLKTEPKNVSIEKKDDKLKQSIGMVRNFWFIVWNRLLNGWTMQKRLKLSLTLMKIFGQMWIRTSFSIIWKNEKIAHLIASIRLVFSSYFFDSYSKSLTRCCYLNSAESKLKNSVKR